MVDEMELKVKIELINDGFLIHSQSGTQFREDLIDAIDVAKEELENWAPEAFRSIEDDVEQFVDTMKKREAEWKEFEAFKRSKIKTADEYIEEAEKYADSLKDKGKGSLIEKLEKEATEQEKKLGL